MRRPNPSYPADSPSPEQFSPGRRKTNDDVSANGDDNASPSRFTTPVVVSGGESLEWCYGCGKCVPVCPVDLVGDYGPRKIHRKVQTGTDLGHTRTQTVRVLLQDNRSSVSFEGASKVGDKSAHPTTRYRAKATSGGVKTVKIWDLSKGGAAIPYHQEDPNIRMEFVEALKKEGIQGRMNPEFYERPPTEGEVVMGDVM